LPGTFGHLDSLFPCGLICRLCCALLILVGAMWFNSHRLLLLVGQEEIIAAMAAKYLRILFPGLCCFMVTQCLQSPGRVVWWGLVCGCRFPKHRGFSPTFRGLNQPKFLQPFKN
jgi:hypothetical protein